MAIPILATKLFIPPPRAKMVLRPRLVARLDEGLAAGRKLALISAPAGFGKTTLLSEWIAGCGQPVAWLSLDEGDSDPARFLTYLAAALQTVAASIGAGLTALLQASQPQPPPIDALLTALLNDIAAAPQPFILVLDDYHTIDARPVDAALAFLLEHLPPKLHLVIATREDPALPLPRLRALDQLTELRAADLRFTPAEAAGFLHQVMGLALSAQDVAALETRTEGWIAGLQLAAISMQGQPDTAAFIQSFTGSHHFVLDYLASEVLQQQPANVQDFLLSTAILDRLCGPLCDAVLRDPYTPGQATLEYLERANLFINPLDNERRWYRYHPLFADLLRQRLGQRLASEGSDAPGRLNELHIRASQWFEKEGLEIEAFQHAAAANDIDRAERLIQKESTPLHARGAVLAILDWLGTLPASVLDARPALWWRYASLLLISGQTSGVEEKLQAAESALQGRPLDERARNLVGLISAARATLGLTRYDVAAMLTQSRRALEYLSPASLISRASANWTLGVGYLVQGDRAAARQAFTEAIALSRQSGAIFTTLLATIGLGDVQEAENQLVQAAETHHRVLQLTGDQPLQIIHESHLGLARIHYEWNQLDAAEGHAQRALILARQYETGIDRFVIVQVVLARLKLARGDLAGASDILAEVNQAARQQNFVLRLPEVAAAQVLVLLRQGNLAAAMALAETHHLPASLARVRLAQGDPAAALALLASARQQVETLRLADERLRLLVLQAIAQNAQGESEPALQTLAEALALAEPGGFVRLFLDEGAPMAQLLAAAEARGVAPGYITKLLAAFAADQPGLPAAPAKPGDRPRPAPLQPLAEPLSQRELEVLRLISQGLSNREISQRLFLALNTVKGHNREIFGKLQVQRRTEAIARARELGLI